MNKYRCIFLFIVFSSIQYDTQDASNRFDWEVISKMRLDITRNGNNQIKQNKILTQIFIAI